MEKTKSDSNLIIMLLALCILGGSYFFGYQAYTDKRTAVEAETAALNVKYDQLIREQSNKSFYLEEIDNYRSEYNVYLNKFASSITEEKTIMFTLDLEEKLGISINSISIDEVNVAKVGAEQTEQTEEEASQSSVYKLTSSVNLNMVSTYKQLKDLLDYIGKYPERMTLGSVSSSYNIDSALLNSNITINLYAALGDGRVPSPIQGIVGSIGSKNIFDANLIKAGEQENKEELEQESEQELEQ